MSTPEPDPGIEVHVGEAVLTRIAGHYARQVHGVAALRPRLIQGVLGMAGRLARGQFAAPWPVAGIETTVDGQEARIEITLSVQPGYNCRGVAETIQQQVRTQISAQTGLAATVGITITDIRAKIESDQPAEADHPEPPQAARQSAPSESPTPTQDPRDVAGGTVGPAEAARRIEAALTGLEDVRLYAHPPFETLPHWPGRPPVGLDLADDAIAVHLAAAVLPLPPLLTRVGQAIQAALADTDWADTPLRLHVDQLDGNPFDPAVE
jgi:uncharacterized alkaline shock family protein YloU